VGRGLQLIALALTVPLTKAMTLGMTFPITLSGLLQRQHIHGA
jgi:hypothetical protein